MVTLHFSIFFPGIEERHNFFWISKPFSGKENSICDGYAAAKIEFFQLRKDARFKTNLTRENIGNFCAGIQDKYYILSKKALSFFIQFSSAYCCEVFFNGVL